MIQSRQRIGDGIHLVTVAGTDEMIELGLIPGRKFDDWGGTAWQISAQGDPAIAAAIVAKKDNSTFEVALFKGDCTILANCNVASDRLLEFLEATIPANTRSRY